MEGLFRGEGFTFEWTEQERRKRGGWAYEPAVTRVCEVEEVEVVGVVLVS